MTVAYSLVNCPYRRGSTDSVPPRVFVERPSGGQRRPEAGAARRPQARHARLGFGYWSLSQYLKHKVKNAVSFISDFEHVLVREAKRRGYDGVVCGHIHKAQIHMIDGILYCNDGDWVESLTAIVETLEGVLKIVTWDDILAPGEPVLRWNDLDTDAEPQAEQAETVASWMTAP